MPGYWITILIASGAVLGLGWFAFRRFWVTPAYLWRRKVLKAHDEAERKVRDARKILHVDLERELAPLKKEYFDRYLKSIAVETLAEYPGIGPVTVERLRSAGLPTVHAVLHRSFLEGDIEGIGGKRWSDIISATKQIQESARGRFDSQACGEAVEFGREKARQEAVWAQKKRQAEHEARHGEAYLASLADLETVARRVTLASFIFRQPVEGLTQELRDRPIPVLQIPPLPAAEPEPPKVELPPQVAAPSAPAPPATTTAPTVPAEAPISTPAPVVDNGPLRQLRVVAGLGYAVARCDGRLAQGEKRQIRAFLERRYCPNQEVRAELDRVVAEVEAESPALEVVLVDVQSVIPPHGWEELHGFANSVANAAGERNAKEDACVARVVAALSRTPATPAPAPKADGVMTEADAREALEIGPGVPLTADLIRRQYRLLRDRFDPARFGSHGADFIAMAKNKRERAEAAARQLLAPLNEALDPPEAPAQADLRHNPDLDAVFGG